MTTYVEEFNQLMSQGLPKHGQHTINVRSYLVDWIFFSLESEIQKSAWLDFPGKFPDFALQFQLGRWGFVS